MERMKNDAEFQSYDIVRRLKVLYAPGNPYLEQCIKDSIQEIEELREALCKVMSIPWERRLEALENKAEQLSSNLR